MNEISSYLGGSVTDWNSVYNRPAYNYTNKIRIDSSVLNIKSIKK